jgi:hypothetical protein
MLQEDSYCTVVSHRQLSKGNRMFPQVLCDKIAALSVFLLWTSTSRATPTTFGNCEVEIGNGLVSTLDAFLRIVGPVSSAWIA